MKSRFYDLQYIKAIPIADYLHACGIKPAKRYNGYALYHAPYREDPNASLKVDFRQNLWHDYGTSQGGSIIDLVMKMRGCSAYEAIAHLAEGKATTLAPSSFHREAHIGGREGTNSDPIIQGVFFPSMKRYPYICKAISERYAR